MDLCPVAIQAHLLPSLAFLVDPLVFIYYHYHDNNCGALGCLDDPSCSHTHALYKILGESDPLKIIKVLANEGKSGEPHELAYTNCKVIGNGSFGVVFQAKLVSNGEDAAIKKVLQDKRFKVIRTIVSNCVPFWFSAFPSRINVGTIIVSVRSILLVFFLVANRTVSFKSCAWCLIQISSTWRPSFIPMERR